MKVEKLLKNKNILYLVISLAVLCSLGYLCVSSYECLAIFTVLYFICCNYIKNKILCIVIALFVSNFVFGCSMSLRGSFVEGYESGKNGPVINTSLAGKIAEAAGKVAQEKTEKAVAKQGASEATQKKEGEEANEEVKNKVVEELRNIA